MKVCWEDKIDINVTGNSFDPTFFHLLIRVFSRYSFEKKVFLLNLRIIRPLRRVNNCCSNFPDSLMYQASVSH
jgi:hypothetical protein